MLIFVELLFLAYVCILIWGIMRKSFRINVFRGIAILCSFAVAFLVNRLLGWTVARLIGNTWNSMLLLYSFVTAIYLAILYLITRRIYRMEERINSWKSFCFAKARCGIEVTLNLMLVLMLLVGVAVFLDFMVSLACLTPLDIDIRSKTLYLRYFSPTEMTPLIPAESDVTDRDMTKESLADIMANQSRAMVSIRNCFRSSMDGLSEKLGTMAVLDDVKILVAILNLPTDDALWLIENTPALKVLSHNSALLAVMEDDHILELVVSVGEGSIGALRELSEHPLVLQLVHDEDVRRSIKSIDLSSLEKAVEEHQRSTEERIDVAWSAASIALSTDLDVSLDDPSRWKAYDVSQSVFTWPSDNGICVLSAEVSVVERTPVTIRAVTEGQVLLHVNRNSMQMLDRGKRKECHLTLDAGTTKLLLMLDFRAVAIASQCEVVLLRQ